MIKNAFELRTIGSLLKERRKERGMSLSEVAEATKIRQKYIEALENSDYSAFSSEVYVKGFLKNYAKLLDINSERSLAMYRREREYKTKDPGIAPTNKVKQKGFHLNITPTRVITGVIILIALLTIYYIGSYAGKILKEPTLSLTKPLIINSSETETYKTTDDSIDISGKADVGSKLTINGQKFDTKNFETFFTTLSLKDGKNEFSFVAESQFGKQSKMTLIVIKESLTNNAPSITITPTPEVILQESFTLKITLTNREAYISVISDGEQVGKRVYQKGETVEFTAKDNIKLYTPRPDAVDASVSGDKYQITSAKTYIWTLKNGEITFE